MSKIQTKVIIVTLFSSLTALLLMQTFNIWEAFSLNQKRLENFKKESLKDYDNNIKFQVETVISMLQSIHTMQKKGIFSEGEAKKRCIEIIRSLRYNQDGYFWTYDTEGILISHPIITNEEGRSKLNTKDKNGNFFIKDIIADGSKEGGGFTNYYFPKIGSGDKAFPKRSYSLLFKPYGWIIGTGNYIDRIEKEVSDKKAYFQKQILKSLVISFIFFLIASVLSVLSARFFSRKYIIKPLNQLLNAFNNISKGDGDLTVQIKINSHDEFSQLANDFNIFVQKIHGIICDVKEISAQLAATSEQLSASSTSLSNHAQSQSSSAQEVTASVEEMSAGIEMVAVGANNQFSMLTSLNETIKQLSTVIDNTEDIVNSSKEKTGDIAEGAKAGEDSLSNMNQSMIKIEKSSEKMKSIIAMINDISDQINLLSLNASIESARAGDAGKGFSVVAGEVSKLAEKTAHSIKEISTLIALNHSEIKNGMENVGESIHTIQTIISEVMGINTMMDKIIRFTNQQTELNKTVKKEVVQVKELSNDINNTTDEQKLASEGIVTEISKINDLTQVNAAASEQMSATSHEVAKMAEALKEKVDFFIIKGK